MSVMDHGCLASHCTWCARRTHGGGRVSGDGCTDRVESFQLARQFLKLDKTEGIVDGESHCHVRSIRGKRKNEDILV